MRAKGIGDDDGQPRLKYSGPSEDGSPEVKRSGAGNDSRHACRPGLRAFPHGVIGHRSGAGAAVLQHVLEEGEPGGWRRRDVARADDGQEDEQLIACGRRRQRRRIGCADGERYFQQLVHQRGRVVQCRIGGDCGIEDPRREAGVERVHEIVGAAEEFVEQR